MAQQHLSGNLRLRQAWPKIEANTTELYERTEPASEEKAGLMSAEDKVKLDGIEDGAEVNQNAFAKVNNVEAGDPSDAVTIVGGTGITVTENPISKEIIVTATGTSTPGPHGTSHLEHGSDPIPLATETDGGLMSAEDKQALQELEGLPDALAELKAESVTGIYNVVTGYGADNTGTSDCSAAVNAAITAANAAGGGEVYFPDGIYAISSPLVLKSNVELKFSPRAILKQMDDCNLVSLITGSGVSNVRITGATFDLNIANQSNYVLGQEANRGRCVFIQSSSSDIKIKNCKALDMFGSSMMILDSTKVYIHHSVINDSFGRYASRAIHLVRVQDAKVYKCRFYGQRNFGGNSSSFGVLAKDNVRNVTVDDCYFHKFQCLLDGSDSGETGVMGNDLKITNCVFIDPLADTTIRYCNYGIISNCIVRGSGDYGISVGDSMHLVIDGNVVQNSNTVGIGVRKSSHVTVANNQLRDVCTNFKGASLIANQRNGIYVLGDSKRVTVVNNTIVDFQTAPAKMYHAIRIEDIADSVKGDDTSTALIANNICFGSSSGLDIYADGVGNRIMPNFRNDGKNTAIALGSDPFAVSALGDFRYNGLELKPYFHDGSAWRLIPKIVSVPANATAPGRQGDIAFDSSFMYICTATNTWRRVGIATW